MLRLLASSAAVALLSTAAIAADIPADEPPPMAAAAMPAYDWTGFYVGINGGWAWGDSEWDVTNSTGPVPDTGVGASFDVDVDGFVIGGHGGYNMQWNWFVLGLEGAVQWSDISGSELSTFGAADDDFQLDVNWLALASLRAGVAIDRVLLYAKGGWAGADVEASFDDNVGANQGSFSEDEWMNGWSVGGGAEFALTQNIILGADYQFIDLGDENFAGAVSGGGTTWGTDVDVQIHEVKGRLSYKF